MFFWPCDLTGQLKQCLLQIIGLYCYVNLFHCNVQVHMMTVCAYYIIRVFFLLVILVKTLQIPATIKLNFVFSEGLFSFLVSVLWL
jgi:hypothetical protein